MTGVIILVVVIAGSLIILWLNSSNQGVIQQTTTPSAPKTEVTLKDLDGKYIQLRYLSSYLVHQLPAKNNDLELYQLSAGTAYTKLLSISVSTLPGGNPDNNSAYVLRQARTDLYTKRSETFGTTTASVWTSTDKTEQTAFVVKGDKIAVLAFTQQAGDLDALTSEVNNVLQSFRWKQ